ncbi:MAG: AAA family ATPase [Candidatus Delongbacteria bacterium]|jgi:predicted ATP-dependent endonuclease of OLD family|nr:AAA family ATPase [Candidatus Delongbacteria bacterium]
MKIKRVFIKEYKNLKDFEINFSSDNYISVIIGKNGSGKSNFLEALTLIFKYLYLDTEKTPFLDFEIEYKCSDNNIKIEGFSTLNKKRQGYEIIVNNSPISFSNFKNDINSKGMKYLPENIILYYSGLVKRLENTAKRFEEDFKRSINNSAKGIHDNLSIKQRPIFYVKPEHTQFMFLSLISSDLESLNNFKYERLNLTQLKKIAIYFKKPSWAKPKGTIENFWGASNGAVLQLLEILRDNSKIKRAIDGELYFLIESDILNKLKKIKDLLGYEKDLFFKFEEAYLNDIITRVSLGFKNPNNDFLIWSDNFSEGEQQFITLKSLTEFIGTNDTLFLFDEPDTYLHPEWQREFIPELEKSERTTQFIITTHSPQILQHQKKEDVFLIEKGEIKETSPTYGRDNNSALFALGINARREDIQLQINNLFSLLEDENKEKALELYEKLVDILGEDDPDMISAKIEIDFIDELD